jgi:peptide/nickel transport system substrate-binding protein
MVERRLTRREFMLKGGLATTAIGAGMLGRVELSYGQGTAEPGLKIALTNDAGSLNPYLDNSVVGLEIQSLIFEPLVDFRGSGAGAGFEATPLVAARWQNRTPTTWRFFLRKGIAFQNGKPLTAEDVQFSIMGVAKVSPSARGKVANITGVSVVDPFTVDITTAGEDASLLSNLGYIFIVPKTDYESRGAAAFGQSPIGSGPYRFQQWVKEQQIVVTAFDGYWDGPQRPARIEIRPITESSTRFAELVTGAVDIIQDVPVQDVAPVRSNNALALIDVKGVRQIYFPMNTKSDTPLRDKRVRQAINFAIDRETIVRNILQGFAEVRTGPWGPGQLGYNSAAAKFYTYDPSKARSLLRAAGYPNGFAVTWNFCDGCWLDGSEALQAIAHQLAAVGIRVNINAMDPNTLFADQDAGHFQIGMIRWSRQYDTDTLIAGIEAQSTTQKWYANTRVDRLIADGRHTIDPAARDRVYQQLFAVLVDDPPYIYTHAQDALWAKRASVRWGFSPFAGNGGVTLLNK